MRRTFTRDVGVTPGAVFCTLVYAVTAGQIVAEFTRHFTRLFVPLHTRCTICVFVHLDFGRCEEGTRDHCNFMILLKHTALRSSSKYSLNVTYKQTNKQTNKQKHTNTHKHALTHALTHARMNAQTTTAT